MSQEDREAHGVVIDQRALDLLLGGGVPEEAPEPPISRPPEVPARPDAPAERVPEAKSAAVSEPPPPKPVAVPESPKPAPVRRPALSAVGPVPRVAPPAAEIPRSRVPLTDGPPPVKEVRGTWATHFNQGLRLENQGRYEDAVREFRVATLQNPGDWRAHFAIGACSLRLGDPGGALAAIEAARRLKPDDRRISRLWAVALHADGALEEAREYYEALAAEMPESEELLANLTLVCAGLGDAGAVSHWAGRLRQLTPGSRQASEAFAAAALVQGDYESAAEHFDLLSKSEGRSYEDWYNLGVCCQMLGRLDEARRAYSRALGIRPDAVEAQANLGTVLHEMHDPRGAREAYLRALRRSPEHAGILGNLSALAEVAGDRGEAEHWGGRQAGD